MSAATDRRPAARRKGQDPKTVNLALQGGGSHGAFTWGVLDRLLEDGRITFDGISGTSAGAMNAVVLADGITRDGRDGARAALDRFWRAIGRVGRFGPYRRTPFDTAFGNWNLDFSPGYLFLDVLNRIYSPYQLNPLDINPLRDVLEEQVDFDAVRRCDRVSLQISATNVRTGKIKVFAHHELSADAVMASACLPHLFRAVEIDGEAYWDGGFMGNPAIYPLIYNCSSRDIVIVQVNPVRRDDLPTSAPGILDRVNEVTFNSSLMREMRAIAFVSRLLEEHRLPAERYKRLLIHRIEAEPEMAALGASSKMNAEWDFLVYLRDVGRQAAADWLERNFDKLGEESTVDLAADYL